MSDIISIAPLAFLFLVALAILTVEAISKKTEIVSFWISVIGIAITVIIAVYSPRESSLIFSNMVTVGGTGWFFTILFASVSLCTVVLSHSYLQRRNILHGEYYALILFATIGMIVMATSADLIVLFLGLEVMSISLYVLAGFMRRRQKSNESALKYFLLGAFATGFLLYGIALVYGVSGTTNIRYIIVNFEGMSSSMLFWLGSGLILVGLSFKVAAVPFHMWVPDVYEGAPTTTTAFMSTGSKAAAFAAFLIVFGYLVDNNIRLKTILAVIAAASMILGNIVAISQSNLKRMLAYSSIAHAGYILTGLAAGNDLGRQGIMFYLAVYAMTNLGAFGILSILERDDEKHLTYEEYSGLSERYPFLSASMAIFMFSLAGIPPFGGFFAKYYVFASAVDANLIWLVVVGVLSSLVSVYYYLRLVVVMYFGQGIGEISEGIPFQGLIVVTLTALLVLFFGVFPSVVLSLTQ